MGCSVSIISPYSGWASGFRVNETHFVYDRPLAIVVICVIKKTVPCFSWTSPAGRNARHVPTPNHDGTDGFATLDPSPQSSGDIMAGTVKIHLSRVSKMSTFTVPRTDMRKYNNPGTQSHTTAYCQCWVLSLCHFVLGSVLSWDSFCAFYCP